MRWTEGSIPDQAGRTAIVTGANTGIGFETARALAACGGGGLGEIRGHPKIVDSIPLLEGLGGGGPAVPD